ncbi:hypothetical protein GA0115240_14671, partial [Streptomyces sp. DvalAA-14]|uniref:hypothetical protein n=1 Tax=Streptomyces sp. DvalAA-14 TaxID=1839759 RepID=UPI00081BC510
ARTRPERGGTLTAGPGEDGPGFTVTAELPLGADRAEPAAGAEAVAGVPTAPVAAAPPATPSILQEDRR